MDNRENRCPRSQPGLVGNATVQSLKSIHEALLIVSTKPVAVATHFLGYCHAPVLILKLGSSDQLIVPCGEKAGRLTDGCSMSIVSSCHLSHDPKK